MFERFTDRSRRVTVMAQEEGRRLSHHYIGTEHILLGLLCHHDSLACQILKSLDISLDDARTQVETILGRGGSPASGHIPFTPRAKKVLELSLREALQLGHNYIGTEHILLGLLREGEGVGCQVLMKLGADLSRVRTRTIQLLGGDSPMVQWVDARRAMHSVLADVQALPESREKSLVITKLEEAIMWANHTSKD